MKKTKKTIVKILDRVAKVAAAHAGEIARDVAISFLLESNNEQIKAQKNAPPRAKKNPPKKAGPKRTAPAKNRQAPNN
jgi:hypothetical protein